MCADSSFDRQAREKVKHLKMYYYMHIALHLWTRQYAAAYKSVRHYFLGSAVI